MNILMKHTYEFHKVYCNELYEYLISRNYNVTRICDKASLYRIIPEDSEFDVVLVSHTHDILACYKDIPVIHIPHNTGFVKGLYLNSPDSDLFDSMGAITDSIWGSRKLGNREQELITTYGWNKSNIHFTGMPITDWLLKQKLSKKYITYFPICDEKYKSYDDVILKKLINICKDFNEELLIKPHPMLKGTFPETVDGATVIFDNDPYKYLIQTKLVISDASALISDAISIDIPIIILNFKNNRDVDEYNSILNVAHTAEELEYIFKTDLYSLIYETELKNYFVGYTDGKCCERIENTITQIVSEGRKPLNIFLKNSIHDCVKDTEQYLNTNKMIFKEFDYNSRACNFVKSEVQ